MPQIFKIGAYVIYFWSNENQPLEPVHVHIAYKKPSKNSVKVWITEAGNCLICHNDNYSDISAKQLEKLIRVVALKSKEIQQKWLEYFGEISYYC